MRNVKLFSEGVSGACGCGSHCGCVSPGMRIKVNLSSLRWLVESKWNHYSSSDEKMLGLPSVGRLLVRRRCI